MTVRLKIAPIVEGHGEVERIRLLLHRIGAELIEVPIEVLAPIRRPRSHLCTEAGLERAVRFASIKLGATEPEANRRDVILVLFDANSDAVCKLAPMVLEWVAGKSKHDVICVLANKEFETWFVGAAKSLVELLDLREPPGVPIDPEGDRCGKGWVASRFRGTKYSPTVDQPRMVARMDLDVCREHCPSFDKLCRDLAARANG